MKNDNEKTAEALWIVLMLLAGMTGNGTVSYQVCSVIPIDNSQYCDSFYSTFQ